MKPANFVTAPALLLRLRKPLLGCTFDLEPQPTKVPTVFCFLCSSPQKNRVLFWSAFAGELVVLLLLFWLAPLRGCLSTRNRAGCRLARKEQNALSAKAWLAN